MSAEPGRHLHAAEPARNLIVVDADTGERLGPVGEYTQGMQDQIDGLETDVRSWRTRYANLKRDKGREALEHEFWPQGVKLFALWKAECKHPKSAFTQDRFWLVQPYLGPQPPALVAAAAKLGIAEAEEPYGPVICEMAVRGAAFEPFTKARANGSVKRFDDWTLIFRNADKVEEFACRAPREPKP